MFSYKKQNKKTDEIFNWGVIVCLNGQEDEKKEIKEKKKRTTKKKKTREVVTKRTQSRISHMPAAL